MDTFFNWKCWDSNRVFASNKALDQHFKDSPVHKIFECGLCGQECVGTAALDKHTAVYHPPPYCGDCEREFVSQQALDQHYRDSPVHKIFECKECGEECFGAAALDEHMDAYHPPAICRQCDREFTSPKALMQHIQESSVHKVFECQECGAECIGKTALDDHMDICHSFACQQCDRQFGSEEALQQHFKDSPVHRIPAFRCADCDREFVSQSALTQHLNSPVHVHRCEECDREFRTAASLQQHKNSPAHVFKCAPCNRTFASKAALDQHLQSRAHATLPPMLLDLRGDRRTNNENFGNDSIWDDIPSLSLQMYPVKPNPSAQVANESSLMEGGTCCICFDMPKTAALVPCGHRLCFECGDVIHKRRGDCPVCNRQIQLVLKLFG